MDEISFYLENGVKPKTISNKLKDISLKRDNLTNGCNLTNSMANLRLGSTLKTEIRDHISRIIGDETISKILVDAIEYTQGFDQEKIRICKVISGTLADSYRTDGMLYNQAT